MRACVRRCDLCVSRNLDSQFNSRRSAQHVSGVTYKGWGVHKNDILYGMYVEWLAL